MPRFTLSVPDDLDDWLEEQYGEGPETPYDSKAEAARAHLRVARRVAAAEHDLDELLAAADRVAELETDLEHAEARQDDLRRQLQAANSRDEDHQELVEYVRDERRIQQRREEREELKATAGLLTRAKWWVTGMPNLDPDGVDRDERARGSKTTSTNPNQGFE